MRTSFNEGKNEKPGSFWQMSGVGASFIRAMVLKVGIWILPPRGHLAMSGDILVVTTGGVCDATDIKWVYSRDTMHGTADNKELPGPKCHRAEAEEPWSSAGPSPM